MGTSRRSFLKESFGLAVPALVSGCASVDRFFLGDKRVLDNEVLIVGGGLSGLVAALELKKNRIPYRLVEARPSLGGRVQTLQSLADINIPMELGADLFGDLSVETHALLKELQIGKVRVQLGEPKNYYQFENRFFSYKELQKQIHPVNQHVLKIRANLMNHLNRDIEVVRQDEWRLLDQESALSYLSRVPVNISMSGLAFIEDAGHLEFGIGLRKISALQMILRWQQMQKFLQPSQAHYQVEGGNIEMIRALNQRVGGVIPEYLVRTQYELQQIIDRGFIFECHFKTAAGFELLFAKNIIFTLPMAAYERIRGLKELDYSEERKIFFKENRMGAHSKILVGVDTLGELPNSFLSSKGQGRWVCNGLQGGGADENRIRIQTLANDEAINAGEEQIQEFCKDLARWSGVEKKAAFKDDKYVVNWSSKSDFRGSKSFLAMGDLGKMFPRLLEPELEGRMYFAGESQNLSWTGSLEGAIISGKRATRHFIQRLKS